MSRIKAAQALLIEAIIRSRTPKIVSNHLWGYVFGCNSIISFVESSSTVLGKRAFDGEKKLPITIFGLDFDCVENHEEETELISVYDESTNHKLVYQGLMAIQEILDEDGLVFICDMILNSNELLDLLQPDRAVIGYFNHAEVSEDWDVPDSLQVMTSICLKNSGSDYLEATIYRVGELCKIELSVKKLIEFIVHSISFGDHSDGELQNKLKEVSGLLYFPFDEFIDDCGTVSFFPEGYLSLVPFAALYDIQ